MAANKAAADSRAEARAARDAMEAAQQDRRGELTALKQQHEAELEAVRAGVLACLVSRLACAFKLEGASHALQLAEHCMLCLMCKGRKEHDKGSRMLPLVLMWAPTTHLSVAGACPCCC